MEFLSPTRKLIKFFENSRNQWKEKAISAKKQVKLGKNRIKFLEESKEKVKRECKEIKREFEQLKAEHAELVKTLNERQVNKNKEEEQKKNGRDKVF